MNFAAEYRKSTLEALERIDVEKVSQAIEWFREARDSGRRIFVCGNGGSASTASRLFVPPNKKRAVSPIDTDTTGNPAAIERSLSSLSWCSPILPSAS